jgi:hypothetical protein
MTEKLNPKKLGLAMGIFFALVHLIWVIGVAIGIEGFLEWILLLHSIQLDIVLTNVVVLNAVLLVIITFIDGFIIGAVFALIYNYIAKCKWLK